MRESLKKKVKKKGKRIVSGVIAAVLAIMLAIPMDFPVMQTNAEEPVNSIEITGGKIKSVTYTVAEIKEDSQTYSYEDKTEDFSNWENDVTTWTFNEEIITKVSIVYEMNREFVMESVQKNGETLNDDQYTMEPDGIITYNAGEKDPVGAIKLICIPKELKVSGLNVVRGQDATETYNNEVVLSWDSPEIPEGSDYSLEDYRLIIQKEVDGRKNIILDENYLMACNEENGTYIDEEADAVSTNAKYIVSVVAQKAYQEEPDKTFYGDGTSADWKALYDLRLSVNGDGKVTIGDKEYVSADTPYIIYNIPSVTEDKVNLEMTITPGENKGVKSLLVNGSEEKGQIKANAYEMRFEQDGIVEISFAPFADTPSITTSGDTYTMIAADGKVEITSAKDVDTTYYGYLGLETFEKPESWNDFSMEFEGAATTVAISADELFGTENYAVLQAYSSEENHADSKVVEEYYCRTPETPVIANVSFDGYTVGTWTTSDGVTLTYENNSERQYAGLEIGYVLNGQTDTKWQDMDQQGNVYSYTFSESGEYCVSLRFKIADPNQQGTFLYGESLKLADNVKIDKEQPVLTASGYDSGKWVTEDVTLNLENNTTQISGTKYWYAISSQQVDAADGTLNWQECTSGNQITISCEDGKTLKKFVYMKAVSNAGKESETIIYEMKIDKEDPAVPEILVNKPDGENGWYATLPKITLKPAAQDSGSEVFTYYKLYDIQQEESTVPEILFDGSNPPEITQQGSYILKSYAKDEAGRVSEVAEQQFYVDTGAPNGPSITFRTENDSVLAHVINFITFGYFCNERVVAVIQSSDSMSQVKEYAVWYTQGGKDGEVMMIQGATAEVELPENFKGTVSAYAVDNAGHSSEVSVSDGIIYESIQAEITITTDVDNTKWQKGDVNFHVITQDEQSGLRNVEYILNGKTVYQNDFTDNSHTDLVYMDQQDIQITEEAASSAGYTLQVKVTDNAGNQSEKSEVIYFDKTAPVISFSGIENGSFSNQTESLTVKVDEQIYEFNNVTVSATRTIDGVTSDYGMEKFVSDSVSSKKSYAFSEDGMYVVTVNAVDAAGNAAVPKQISFTIDKTAPKIEINGPQNDSYHASDVPVEVNVEESFFDTNTVTINVTRTLDGQTGNVDFGNWNNQGKSSSLSRSFGEDGTYQIEVQAKDAAGNQAAVQQLIFTVDKTAPEVSINGAGDYLITGNAITLSCDVVESYFDTNNVSIQVQKEDAEGNVTDINVGNWVNSGKESSLSYELKEEGIYTSIITAVDKAGNESTARKTVTVDTSDPVIRHVDEINGKYYQVFKLPYELSEMINDLTVPTISMYLNSDEYDGVSEVTEEGKYVFRMDVSDEVGHKAIAQAEFIVDNTEPKVIFNGVEDGMKSDSDIAWSVSLADAKDIMKEVLVDGEKKAFDAETNSYQETLSQKGTHTIEVSAEDLAGNTTRKVISVEISEAAVIASWSANKPLMIGGIAVAVGVAGVGAGYATGFFGKGTGKRLLKKK